VGDLPPRMCGIGDDTAKLAIALHRRLDTQVAVLSAADLDAVLGGILLTLAVLIILFFAALLRLVSPGWPFFSQEREGFRGTRFRLWKIRTMYQTLKNIWRGTSRRSWTEARVV
jgi:lipopolysaccharide/colanic/teichoic acid biosynthesis glycosyltransferase